MGAVKIPAKQRPQWVPGCVLVVMLSLTLIAWRSSRTLDQARDRIKFDDASERTRQHLQLAIKGYLTLLDGLRGLVNGGISLKPEQFNSYLEPLGLGQNYPGVQGLGFAMRVPRQNKTNALSRAQASFHVWPDSDQPELCPVILAAPPDKRNRALAGYDMFSDPRREAAMKEAIDTGKPSVTGRVMPETSGQEAAGFVIFAPMYFGGPTPASLEERRRLIFGFSFCTVQADDLFKTLAGLPAASGVIFRVYDGTELDQSHLLYDSERGSSGPSVDTVFYSTNTLRVADRTWSLVCYSGPKFAAGFGTHLSPFILLGGILVSLLVFGITLSQAKAHAAAEQHVKAVLSAERKFQRLVEQSIVGIYIIQDDRFVYVNPKMKEIFGYSGDELTSAPVIDFMLEADRPLVKENIRKRMTGEVDSICYKLRGLRKDGTMIHIEAHGGRTEYLGRPAILGTLLDVTERTKAEEELQKLHSGLEQRVLERTAQLEEANKELESFSYSVSHDLRAPLRHIEGYVGLAIKHSGDALDEKSRRFLNTVSESATDMGRLIDDLLKFSRMGRTEMQHTTVNLEELVQETLRGLERDVQGRNIVWKCGPLPRVQGDRSMLRQVFVNLMANAVKYTRPRDPAQIEIGCAGEEEGKVVLFVRDNGVGFDMKYADKLFGVFQRLHHADEFEGTGVGLANVRRIVNRHGGRIWAEAALNAGATFYFTLTKS